VAHPTRFERVTLPSRATSTPNPETTHLIKSQEWVVSPRANHATACHHDSRYVALRNCAMALHDVDSQRKLKGWARTWMSHDQIPRLDGDQPSVRRQFALASRLMAVLSMTGHGRDSFVEGENSLFGVAQTVVWPRRSKLLYLSMGVTDTLSLGTRTRASRHLRVRLRSVCS